jgi:hypothetical protein
MHTVRATVAHSTFVVHAERLVESERLIPPWYLYYSKREELMDLWTEILTEDVGATHVEDQTVVWAMDGAREYNVRAVKEQLERRRAWRRANERFIERSRQMREQMDRRQEAADVLREHGYGDQEIPL